jgi:hypothetical protein
MPVSSLLPHTSPSVFGPLLPRRARASLPDALADLRTDEEIAARIDRTLAAAPRRRTAIWDMHNSLHCSIVGTCLSTDELRRLLVKLRIAGAETANDHDRHMLGVMLAGRPQAGAKLLQKTLDRRHESALKQTAKAKDAAELVAYWDDALKRGDIPGAYWAVLSHPVATDDTVRRVFGDVHMLSHLVGAANRADIRRLRALEEENSALTARLDKQQGQLRDGFVARDETIRDLKASLSRLLAQPASSSSGAPSSDDLRIARDTISELEQRLSLEIGRRERMDQRLDAMSEALRTAEKAAQRAARERDGLMQELTAVEDRLERLLSGEPCDAADGLDLSGKLVLYVGGRAHQVPQLKALVERVGADFAHHDGGVEHNPALLPGLVGRADVVLFPVDCISHLAVAAIKRHCRQAGKPYVPLRTSSLAACLSGLSHLRDETSPLVPELTS